MILTTKIIDKIGAKKKVKSENLDTGGFFFDFLFNKLEG